MSQQTLAKKTGVAQPSISDLESGTTKEARGPTLLALATALQVRPDWLLYNRGSMDEEPKQEPSLPSDLKELADLWDYVSPATKREFLERCRNEAVPALEKAVKVLEKHGVKGYVSDARVAEALKSKKETNRA